MAQFWRARTMHFRNPQISNFLFPNLVRNHNSKGKLGKANGENLQYWRNVYWVSGEPRHFFLAFLAFLGTFFMKFRNLAIILADCVSTTWSSALNSNASNRLLVDSKSDANRRVMKPSHSKPANEKNGRKILREI